MNGAMRVRLKLQWRLQEVRETRNMECLPTEAADSMKSQFKRGHEVTIGKAQGAGLPKPFGAHIPHALDGRPMSGFDVCQARFGSCSDPVSHYFSIPSFCYGNG
jgi:hypothetical protein